MLGFQKGTKGKLEFESGLVVEGLLEGRIVRDATTLVLSFSQCKVTLGERVLFDPAWGIYDMACGSSVDSVFGGAGDRGAYLAATGEIPRKKADQKSNLMPADMDLNRFFEKIRKLRDLGQVNTNALLPLCKECSAEFPNDWLSRIELLELLSSLKDQSSVASQIKKLREDLTAIGNQDETKRKLIERGLKILVAR